MLTSRYGIYVTRVVIKYSAVIRQVEANLTNFSTLALNTPHQQEDINDYDKTTCFRTYKISLDCVNSLNLESGINLLKPTGHVMHQQFNIQQLHALPTLYLCVLYLSENKQRLVPLTA